MVLHLLTLMRVTNQSSAMSSTWLTVEREQSWSHLSPLLTVPDYMEHMQTLRIVESSGTVRMVMLIDTSVHQALLLIRTLMDVCGLPKLLTAAALLSLSMTKEVNSSAQQQELLVPSASMPTLLTAGSISSVLMESPGSRVVLQEKFLTLDQDPVRMGSAQTQSLCLNVLTTMLVVMMWN